jgi:hypothetical protein
MHEEARKNRIMKSSMSYRLLGLLVNKKWLNIRVKGDMAYKKITSCSKIIELKKAMQTVI